MKKPPVSNKLTKAAFGYTDIPKGDKPISFPSIKP